MASRYHMMDILRRQLEVGSTTILYRTKIPHKVCVWCPESFGGGRSAHCLPTIPFIWERVRQASSGVLLVCADGVCGIYQPADVDSWEQTVEQTERFSDTVAMAGQMKPDRSTGRANQRMREHGFQHRLSPCRKSIISIVPRVILHCELDTRK